LNLGFYCFMGSYVVSWVFDGEFLLYLRCLLEASFVFWVSCGFWMLWVCSFLWVFLGFSYGLAVLFLCIRHVYLGAPYAFLMKFSYLSKNKGRFSFPFISWLTVVIS
jgi:hypothetical protein